MIMPSSNQIFNTIFFLLFFTPTLYKAAAQKNPLKFDECVLIDDDFSMKSKEVTVNEWIEFIANNNFDTTLFPQKNGISRIISVIFEDLKKGSSPIYLSIREDSKREKKGLGNYRIEPTRELIELFDNDTNYCSLTIPITGITYEQALRYCSWKEAVINNAHTSKVKIGLPTIENYKRVIANLDSINEKECALYNWMNCGCRVVPKSVKLSLQKAYKSQGKCLLQVDSYWPNELGLYNVQGNASEMTSSKGIAKGGSYRHYARQSFNDKIQEYSKPEAWLGFRYIITLKE